jgi:hypothetical protein
MPGAAILLRFVGIKTLIEAFDEILKMGLEEQRRGDWYVVSAVEYAEILEWNTPHWRVAIQMVADEITLDVKQQQDMLNIMIAGGSLTKATVTRLASKIRMLISANGLVDTGNYIGSIAIGPTQGEAFLNSEAQLLDPSTSVIR